MDSVIKLKENYIINKIAESVRKEINEEENLSDLAYKIYGSEDNSKGYYKMPRKSPFTKVDTLNNGKKFKISPDEVEKMKGLLSKNYNATNVKENRFNNNLIRLTESDLHKIVKESVKRVLRENAELDNGGPYYLYVNYDCIGEYDNYNEAKNDAIRYHKKYPDAIIDVNDNTDENSVFGFGN